jgi:hypothetical protein
MLRGGPDDGMGALVDPVTGADVDVSDVPAQGLTQAVAGEWLDGPVEERVQYVTGRYDEQVRDLTVVLGDGRVVLPSVGNRWWVAWWNGDAPAPLPAAPAEGR